MWYLRGIFISGTYLAIIFETTVAVGYILVDMCKKCVRWSQKGYASVTLRKPGLFMFIIQVFGRQSFESFSRETELQVDMMILMVR